MPEIKRTNQLKRPQSNLRRDSTSVAKFVEELSWLLSSHDHIDFRALRQFSRELADRDSLRATRSIAGFGPKNPNISFLVGSLPGLFNDPSLFRTNEEIAEFAVTALHVRIPRWQKKSKFELIGHIVCNTAKLSDKRLEMLVRALSHLVRDDKRARAVVTQRRTSGQSWNEVIQKLLNETA